MASADGINWSISKLFMYESCPMRFRLKYIDRIPELPPKPDSPLERGNRIHGNLENFLKDKEGGDLKDNEAKRIEDFKPALNHLKELYDAGKATAEDNWFYNYDWEVCDRKSVWLWAKLDFYVFDPDTGLAIVGDYKGLPLDTLIPTPLGFTTMGEAQVGQTVFDGKGQPCKITNKSQVSKRDCYKVTFDDATAVVCDDVHQWSLTDGRVVSVLDLKKNDLVHTAEPIKLPHADLPIDPYVLGVWLADGKHTSAEVTKPDAFIWGEIQRRGYSLGSNRQAEQGKCRTQSILGIRGKLADLNLLGNKHIPAVYMRASVEQRLDLLRGIMDGDGYANPVRKQAVLVTVDPAFSDQVLELARSLGQRATQFTAKGTGFGKPVTSYPVVFRPRLFNPFLLPRKAEVAADWGPGYSWRRRVMSVRPVAPRKTQCIMVDSPDHTFLCTEAFVPTHNSGKSAYKAVEHTQQTQLYAAVAAIRNEHVKRVVSELWYVDEGHVMSRSYTAEQAMGFISMFDRRVDRIYQDRVFKPNANAITCKWCPYGPRNGNGQCPVGV